MMCPRCWLALFALFAAQPAAIAQTPNTPIAHAESLELPGGRRLPGRLAGDATSGFRFVPTGGGTAVALGPGSKVGFEGSPASPPSSPPPFLLIFGEGQRLSGRAVEIAGETIRLDQGAERSPVIVTRAGALALIQKPGEAAVLIDAFDSLDPERWSVTGDPALIEETPGARGRFLELSASGASATTHLTEPIAAGRLEISYFDPGKRVSGRRQFVDLGFRTASGDLAVVRAILGWAEETLGVESPSGPTLAVQPLARKAGWHRLVVRFAPDRLDLVVDRLELAHGDGPPGGLVEVRLATEVVEAPEPATGLAARFDDLQISRVAAPSGRLEIDPSQDEVRLVTGDQVFGSISRVDGKKISIRVDDRAAKLAWSEVSGLYFRRIPATGAVVDGLLVHAEWRPSGLLDPFDLESMDGALSAVSDQEIAIKTAYAGTLAIPRNQLTRLDVTGRGTRIVLDSKPHHLGDRTVEDLDPPQPEGDTLTIPFDLVTVPSGSSRLAVDVVQVVSASGNPEQRVNPGELSTHVLLNDREVDILNRHVSARNESPERVFLAIPQGLLRVGRNQVVFRQSGSTEDPKKRDNLGVLGIALESSSSNPVVPGIANP